MKKGHVPASIPAEPHLRKQLLDPEFAAAYLSYTAESDDPSDFMFALREVAEAYGGIGKLAKRAKLNRQQLYKTLSREGNPELRTLRAMLGAAGFLLTVVPKERLKERTSRPQAVRNQKAGARFAAKPAVVRKRVPESGVLRQT
jgi:probable addiction module antidote protein